MKLYAEYIKETCGRECIYNEDSFYTYIIKNNTIYLEEAFIAKEKRGSGMAEDIIKSCEKVGIESGCKYITSSTCKNSTEETLARTDKVLSRNGFVIYDEDDYMIRYVKEIK